MLQRHLQSFLRFLKPIIGIEIAVMTGVLFCFALTIQSLPVNAADTGFKEGSPALVIISANWCAKCRDMPQIASNVIQGMNQPNFRIVTLDVDNSSTAAVAKRYGINLQGNAVPQIYLFSQGKTKLLLDANSYELGNIDQASQSIQQQMKTP